MEEQWFGTFICSKWAVAVLDVLVPVWSLLLKILLPSIVVRASSSVYNLFFNKVPIWHAFINGG